MTETASNVTPLHRPTDAQQSPLVEAAPAKVNLFLHLQGLREDGYHLLESLVVFPDLGDRLEWESGPGLSLSVEGPFAWDLPADSGNLVLRAAEGLARETGAGRQGAALRLVKNLPVASGIGGGSSDAAAALRLLARAWSVALPAPADLALSLGADVPVCLGAPEPMVMEGIGEVLRPAPALPRLWIVLVNPLKPVETRAVFRETREKDGQAAPPLPPAGFQRAQDLIHWLGQTRNDLEPAARRLCPTIEAVMESLSEAPLARMSGSGATCFALFPDRDSALAVAESVRAAHPEWWCAAGSCP